ncbi:MAG: hypothetical protein EBZ48_18130 [Proteobacteria bacterium]|nr:hypothetical protein [Pseudomonadota bacterium]
MDLTNQAMAFHLKRIGYKPDTMSHYELCAAYIEEGMPDLNADNFWDILLDGTRVLTQYGTVRDIERLVELLNKTTGNSEAEFTAIPA